MTETELVEIGKVLRTQGLKGYVRVHLFSDTLKDCLSQKEVSIKKGNGNFQSLKIEKTQPYKGNLLIKFEGLSHINDVIDIVKSILYLKKSHLPPLEEDEYYHFQLKGLKLITKEGSFIGTVVEIIPTAANEVLVAKDGEKEYFLPFIGDVIERVDLDKGLIFINPLEGLIENA